MPLGTGRNRGSEGGCWRRAAIRSVVVGLSLLMVPPAAADSLPNRVTQLEAMVAALTSQILEQSSQVTALRTELAHQISRNEALQETADRQAGRIEALEAQLAAVQERIGAGGALREQDRAELLAAARTYTDEAVRPLADKLAHFSRQGNDLFLTGANLHVVNGTGSPLAVNGLGNLIVGYNEPRDASTSLTAGPDNRSGSHCLVIGQGNNFSGWGGLVAGANNSISGGYSSVTGGQFNRALTFFASVSGGAFNTSNHYAAAVSGGEFNRALGRCASVSGGQGNTAQAPYSAIGGGAGITLAP